MPPKVQVLLRRIEPNGRGGKELGSLESASGSKGSELGRVTYRLWPWMAWLLPVALFVLMAACGAGGWEMLFVMLYSPIILPAYALLSLLPRLIIRKSGRRATPHSVGVLLVVHWCSLTAFALFVRGYGDSGSLDSAMGEILGWLPESVENAVSLLGALIALFSWLGVLVLSFIKTSADKRRDLVV